MNKTYIINPPGNWSCWSEQLREELKSPSDTIGQTIVLETDSFRVWSIHLSPGTRLPFHKHCRPYFWTALTVGKAISHFGDGSIVETEYTVDSVKNFSDLNSANYFIHDLKNIGNTTLVFTTVEFLK